MKLWKHFKPLLNNLSRERRFGGLEGGRQESLPTILCEPDSFGGLSGAPNDRRRSPVRVRSLALVPGVLLSLNLTKYINIYSVTLSFFTIESPNSSNCFSSTTPGALVIRQEASFTFGNAITSRILSSFAISITIRSSP